MSSPSARPANRHRERWWHTVDFASVTTTTTLKRFKCKGRSIKLARAQLNLPAGLVQDASNYFVISLMNGSTTMASYSTQTAGQGTITANTPVELVLSATPANLFLADGDQLSLALTLHGTQTLPLGTLSADGFEL